MKNVAILSLSLVALSGGAGLGLSALHEFNMNVQTSALSTPDSIPADSGFVIPDYVPDAAQFAAFAPSLPTPSVFEESVFEPVRTAALDEVGSFDDTFDNIESPNDIDDVDSPRETNDVADTRPVTREIRTGVDAPIGLIRTRANRPAAEAPVFVAQAPAFAQLPKASSRIDYVIGVYR